MNTCYAVIDTNILVSALLTSHDDAATVRVIDKVFSGEVIPVFSAEILKEYNDVLRRTKFHFSEHIVSALINALIDCGELIVPTPSSEVLPDMKDLPFYEVVLEKRNEDDACLITGNTKHFPKKAFIVTANEFLRTLDESL